MKKAPAKKATKAAVESGLKKAEKEQVAVPAAKTKAAKGSSATPAGKGTSSVLVWYSFGTSLMLVRC